MEFKKFKSIGQYKNIIKSVRLQAQFVGLDENDKPIYDQNKSLPTIEFKGTVKLHGTNAGLSYSKSEDILIPQKRSSALTGMHGHFGFVEYVKANEDILKTKMSELCDKLDVDVIYVFGEWVGNGIQGKVAISELSKRFVIFESWNPVTKNYIDPDFLSDFCVDVPKCYNIRDYKTYNLTVDTQYPELAMDTINKLIDEVENCCPVSKAMLEAEGVDIENREEFIGEGIVWTYNDITFKSKGEKHSNQKGGGMKATVDPIRAKNIKEFAEKTATEYRLHQCYNEIKSDVGEVEKKHLSDLLRWLFNDIIKEEGDDLQHNNLTKKDVSPAISNIARPWFIEKIESFD